MQSLEARKAFRAKQRELEKQDPDHNPTDAEEATAEFDAAEWLDDTVENIAGAIGDLTPEQLDAIEAQEKSKKDRAGVKNAIAEERKKRESASSSWSNN